MATVEPASTHTWASAAAPSAPALRPVPTAAALAAAVGLIASGLLTTIGGAVRWAECLTPDTVVTCASMHGEAASAAMAQATPFLAAGWFVLAATFLGLTPARGLPAGARSLLVISGIGAGAMAIASLPSLDASPTAGPVGLILLLGVPAVVGAILVAEGGRAAARSWWLGLALVVVGVGHSILGWALPSLWSDSADDPVGLFLVAGVLTVVAGAVALWGAARSR